MKFSYPGSGPFIDLVTTFERPDPKDQINEFLKLATYQAENARGFPTAPNEPLLVVHKLLDTVDDREFREAAIERSDAILRHSYEVAIEYCVDNAAKEFCNTTSLPQLHSAKRWLDEATLYARILEYRTTPDSVASLERKIQKEINRRTPWINKLLNTFGDFVLIPLFGDNKAAQSPTTYQTDEDELGNLYQHYLSQ
mgnify:FL=1